MTFSLCAHQFAYAFGLCVGNEYLSESIAVDKAHDVLHAPGIQFVENVVEQQYRFTSGKGCYEMELG